MNGEYLRVSAQHPSPLPACATDDCTVGCEAREESQGPCDPPTGNRRGEARKGERK